MIIVCRNLHVLNTRPIVTLSFGFLHLSYRCICLLSLASMILTLKRSSCVQGFNDHYQQSMMQQIFLFCTFSQTSGDDSFDARMAMIARRHSHLYASPQTLTDQSQHSAHSIDQSQHRHSSQSLSSNDRTDQSVPRQHSAMTIQTEHELSHTDRKLPQRSATFASHRNHLDSSRGQRSSRKDSRPPRSDASE